MIKLLLIISLFLFSGCANISRGLYAAGSTNTTVEQPQWHNDDLYNRRVVDDNGNTIGHIR